MKDRLQAQERRKHQESQSMLETQDVTMAEDPDVLLSPGDILNDIYVVTELLGQGGMGQVYEAHDIRLNRPVALKILFPKVAPARLRAEAQALALLHHPGLVTIHSMATHNGMDYIVLERLHGLTLHACMLQRGRGRPFVLSEALKILISIADTLAYIHSHDIVHRDLKPDNIMLENNRVVLMDFGLIVNELFPMSTTSGSPYYMAPETITGGNAARVDPRVDIYSLGIIAFEMLTGRKPFAGFSAEDVMNKHVGTPPPEITAPDVPVHLKRLVCEMLAKKPEDRPSSAVAIGMWLRALASGREIPETAPTMSVLVVDDDPDMRALLSAGIRYCISSVDISVAEDGLDALQQFCASPPDVMLFDLNMPKMTGIELCMHLRGSSLADETSLIAISVHDSEDEWAVLKRLGVRSLISKLSNSDHLLERLRVLITGIHDERERLHDTQKLRYSGCRQIQRARTAPALGDPHGEGTST